MLMPTIDKLLKGNKLSIKDVDAIAISKGPGSFTGLRIGVATCKGISLALGIKVIGVPTLDVIAENFISYEDHILCPVIDAKKNKLYSAFYKVEKGKLKKLSEDMLIDADLLVKKIKKPTLMFGDGIKIYEKELKKNKFVELSKKEWFPKAEIVAKIGSGQAKKKRFVNSDKLVPLYLHSQYCQVRGYKK